MSRAFQLDVDSHGIARLTFDLPGEKVNKFSSAVVMELNELLDGLSHNREIKAMAVVSGKKDIFIAGADINELKNIRTENEAYEKSRTGQEIFRKLSSLPFPTIALIDGACLGGGLEFALWCTYRLATDNKKTTLGFPEVMLGILPAWGGTQLLPPLIGIPGSLEMILTGKNIPAIKAAKMHLVDMLVPAEFKEQKLNEFVQDCLSKRKAKEIVSRRGPKGPIGFLLSKTPIGRWLVYRQSRKKVYERTKGSMPAPLSAINVVRKTYRASLKKGLHKEAQAFSKLAAGSVSKNLVQLYFTNEELKKDKMVFSPHASGEIKTVGILGAGTMGGGLAWLFSFNDLPVRLKTTTWESVAKGLRGANSVYKQLLKRRKLKPGEINIKMHKISGAVDYTGFSDLDLVIEAVTEDIEVKKEVMKELELVIKPEAIVCSNTSSFSITQLAQSLSRPERFCGTHFFNPVNRMPLVEVVRGQKTSDETVSTVVDLIKKLGKTPIVVKDCPGFLVNRMFVLYMNEILFLLEEGADVVKTDKLMEKFGMPMGPCILADEIGLDAGNLIIKVVVEDAYGERLKAKRAAIAPIMTDSGLLGRKGGKGFYIYSAKSRKPNPDIPSMVEQARKADQMERRDLSESYIIDRAILMMVNEAAKCLEEGVVSNPKYLDMAMVMGIGFPPSRGGILRYADHRGISEIVDRLDQLAEESGPRYQPVSMLRTMAREGRKFYQ